MLKNHCSQKGVSGKILEYNNIRYFRRRILMKKEIWKKMKSPFLKYSISSTGRVRNDKTGYLFLCSNKISGYIRVALSGDDKKTHYKFIHVLVADAFCNKSDENHSEVHHKDRNRENNNVENLEYISPIENRRDKNHMNRKSRSVLQYDLDGKFIRKWDRIVDTPFKSNKNISSACAGRLKSAHGFLWEYYEEKIEGEEWKDFIFNERKIRVSNFGRIELPSGKKTYGREQNGYRLVNVDSKSSFVHRLVMILFDPCNSMDMVVNHKDSNRSNNRIENLEWITQKQNTIHSWKKEGKGVRNIRKRKVLSIDQIGDVVEYSSISEASVKLGVSKGNICMVCNGNRKSAGGFMWKYKDLSEESELLK